MKKNILLLMVAFAVMATTAVAQIPTTLNLQGMLIDDTVNPPVPVNGTVDMVLRIFAGPTGGSQLDFGQQNGVQVVDGYYNVSFGPFTLATANNATMAKNRLWYELSVNGTVIPGGRVEFDAVPFAWGAKFAEFTVFADTARVAIPAGPAGGILTGTYPDPQINTNALTTIVTPIVAGIIGELDIKATPTGKVGGTDIGGYYPDGLTINDRRVDSRHIAFNAIRNDHIADETIGIHKIYGLTATITDIRADIATLDAKVDTEVARLDTKVDTEVARLDGRIDFEATRITNLKTEVDNEVARLDGRINTTNTEVERLDGKINTESARLDGRINTEATRITDLNTKVDTEVARLDGRIDTVATARITTLNEKVDGEVERLDGEVEMLAGEVERLDDKIDAVTLRVGTIEVDRNTDFEVNALTVMSDATFGTDIDAPVDVTIYGNLEVFGTISGHSIKKDTIVVADSMHVYGKLIVDAPGELIVEGTATFESDVTFRSDVTFGTEQNPVEVKIYTATGNDGLLTIKEYWPTGEHEGFGIPVITADLLIIEGKEYLGLTSDGMINITADDRLAFRGDNELAFSSASTAITTKNGIHIAAFDAVEEGGTGIVFSQPMGPVRYNVATANTTLDVNNSISTVFTATANITNITGGTNGRSIYIYNNNGTDITVTANGVTTTVPTNQLVQFIFIDSIGWRPVR